MALKKSPGGSIFPYYYKNGELFGAHFGSFFDNEAGLIQLIQAETDFFLDQHRQLPYWVDLYESRLTEAVLTEFLRSMNRLAGCITRLAIVGCYARDRRRFEKVAREKDLQLSIPFRYFSDPEVAKTWLVSDAAC
jgi:hypothetical protein